MGLKTKILFRAFLRLDFKNRKCHFHRVVVLKNLVFFLSLYIIAVSPAPFSESKILLKDSETYMSPVDVPDAPKNGIIHIVIIR